MSNEIIPEITNEHIGLEFDMPFDLSNDITPHVDQMAEKGIEQKVEHKSEQKVEHKSEQKEQNPKTMHENIALKTSLNNEPLIPLSMDDVEFFVNTDVLFGSSSSTDEKRKSTTQPPLDYPPLNDDEQSRDRSDESRIPSVPKDDLENRRYIAKMASLRYNLNMRNIPFSPEDGIDQLEMYLQENKYKGRVEGFVSVATAVINGIFVGMEFFSRFVDDDYLDLEGFASFSQTEVDGAYASILRDVYELYAPTIDNVNPLIQLAFIIGSKALLFSTQKIMLAHLTSKSKSAPLRKRRNGNQNVSRRNNAMMKKLKEQEMEELREKSRETRQEIKKNAPPQKSLNGNIRI